MPSPLVETKLHVPKLRRRLVARPRLSGRLRRETDSHLTLVSAPAGFGKTTLLAEWLAATPTEGSVAWLSLEESDRQPASYWTYLITALQAVAPGAGTSALPLLQSGQPPIETVLTTVVNELGNAPGDLYLVLDDYHLVDGPDLQAGMTFLLEHLPPQAHLVISPREDPALPLARLRAHGELVEVRAADLRFTLDEVAAYLNDVTGLKLAAGDIAALEGRTEGWIAALQLAALSMQGRDDVAGFIASFAGDDRYIVDYLVDEVLGRQPAHVRGFLLQTSILDRLSGPLCDAVTGQDGGKAMLESLDRANLFLVPLDDSRRWYRYHHLFADVLRTHLLDEQPGAVAGLHRRASQWYEEHGEPSPAIRHALAATDVERAAALVELAIPELRRNRQEATIWGWLDAIGDDVIRGAARAGGGAHRDVAVRRGVRGRRGAAARRRAVAGAGWRPCGHVDAAGGDGRRRPARIPTASRGDPDVPRRPGPDPGRHSRHHRPRPAGDRPGGRRRPPHPSRGVGPAGARLLGRRGPRGRPPGLLRRGRGLRRAGYIADVLGSRSPWPTSGSPRAAWATRNAPTSGPWHSPPARADRAAGNGRHGRRDEPDRLRAPAATRHLGHAQELGEHTWLPQNPYRWRVAMARVREAEGDLDGALDLLEEAQGVYVGDFSPDVRPIPARRATWDYPRRLSAPAAGPAGPPRPGGARPPASASSSR